MTVLDGYRAFFEKNEDPNLKESRQRDGIFFIYHSFDAWKEERCRDEDIPEKELVLSEFTRNRFLAHP